MKWLVLSSLLFVSCAQIKPINEKKPVIIKKEEPKIVLPIINRPIEVEVQPGKVTFVEFAINLPDGKWILNCKYGNVSFVVLNKKAQLFLAETYFSDMKPYKCSYVTDEDNDNVEDLIVLNVNVVPFKYKKERLYVDQKKIDLSKKDLERVLKEKEITEKLYDNSASYYFFEEPFMTPLDSFITSYYGNKRIFNNKKQSQHLGNDFRAAVGVPIPVANKGKVIFVGDLFYTGKVVVVDHGLDIFTMYGHLSNIKVNEGDIINKGDIVGLAGATGRVSGPHLHWGVKIQGHWVDGFSLVQQSKLKI